MSDIKVRHQEILENAIYTPCEVAFLLKVGRDIIYKMVKNGEIKFSRIGDKKTKPPIRILGSDLIDYMKNIR